jgi:predicted ribosome quality control (RQC) complex YloA/Tae2 family protein
MTFQCAKGPDLWLHISGQPGPHLVIPKPPDKEISHKTLLEALQLVLHFSGKLTSGEITVTERKQVHKRKGDPKGTVTLSKMKTYHASKNEPLLAALLQSKFTLLP